MSASEPRRTGPAQEQGILAGRGRPTVRRRLRSASETQRALLPPAAYTGKLVEAAAVSRPRWALGGDFYDYVDTGREFRVVLGDACGKGTAAALQAAVVQGILAIEADEDGGPARLVTHLNRALCRRAIPARFVTLFYAVLGPGNELRYCNAGVRRPLLVNRATVYRLTTGGPPLGLFRDARFEEGRLSLHAEDMLAVCSDGVLEAAAVGKPDVEFGDGRVLEVIRRHRDRSCREILETLEGELSSFTGGAPPQDDLTAMVVRYRGA